MFVAIVNDFIEYAIFANNYNFAKDTSSFEAQLVHPNR